MSVLSSRVAGASHAAEPIAGTTATVAATDAASTPDVADAARAADLTAISGPVMFCVRDAGAGEVAILHGDAEVVVRDRQLVERIVLAAHRAAV